MINPSWRRFLSRKRFEVAFERKTCGFVMRIESGRRTIINHDVIQGQGNSTSCQKICNVHDSASLVVDCKSLTLGWISLSLYKVVVLIVSNYPVVDKTYNDVITNNYATSSWRGFMIGKCSVVISKVK